MIRNPDCDKCFLRDTVFHNPCVCGWGNPNADLMVIGEAPGSTEDRTGTPFSGEAGGVLWHVAQKLGLDVQRDMFLTNVLRCRPENNKFPGKKDAEACFEECWPYLETELQEVDPKAIVLLGANPLMLLVGVGPVTRYECMEVETIYEGARTFAAYHPAFVLRQPSKEIRLAQAIARAAKAVGLKVKPKGWEAGRIEYEVRM